ncbi:MAG: PKD domain-containing protein [Pseudomonadota bacterium]|nr:MAG: PKD domain-containing protein [Pseudomonadota bacterium]
MNKIWIAALSGVLALSLWRAGVAQVPPVEPGFPTDHACTPGQLLYRQVGLGRVANIVYHNGVILSSNVGGGSPRWWRFTDVDDPTSLAVYDESSASVPTDHGTHAHTKLGDYVCGAWGCRVRRDGPGNLANELMSPSAPGEITAGFTPQNQPGPAGGELHRLYYPWAMPFNWIQYGENPGQGRLWRGDELLAEWEPLADHGVAGNAILIGNYLFMVSDASMLGVVAYDIGPVFDSPPGPPQFLDKLSGTFGAYIGTVWENYLLLAGGNPRNLFYVVDYADPTNLELVATMNLDGNPALDAGTNVPYVQVQDEFAFTRRHKINMETLTPVLELDEVGDNRPPGSVSGPLDVSQYAKPLGNLLVTGAYSFAGRDGVGVWCHQAAPDTRGPYVGYHVPRPGQTHYPLGAPVSLVIAETLESFTIINGETIILRPVGGAQVDAWVSFSHDSILTLTPYAYLEPDTTYEVVLTEDGIKDAAGNGMSAYSFTFSTGSSVGGGNQAPAIDSLNVSPSPIEPGQSVTIDAVASDADSDPLEYRFGFGDGTPTTAWSSSTSVAHTYQEAGHFEAKVQVRDLRPDGSVSVVTETRTVTVAPLPAGPLPTHSSTLAVDESRRVVWVANPDHATVARMDADSGERLAEINLADGAEPAEVVPWNVAVAADGEVWVTLRDADAIVVLDANGSVLERIELDYGSAPHGVALSPDDSSVFVATHAGGTSDPGNGQLLRYERASRNLTGQLELGPTAGALAVSGDGSRVYVARFLSGTHYGEIWQVDAAAMSLERTLPLWRDRGRGGLSGGGSLGPGVPNYIAGLTIDPHGDWLWYTGIKTDTNRGEFFDQDTGLNLPLAHDSTVRPMLGRVELAPDSGPPAEPGVSGFSNGRIDADNADSPSALVFSPRGDYVFGAMQGNDFVMIFDDLAIQAGGGRSSRARLGSGSAPRGLAFDSVAETLWVQNFLSRDVSRIDVSAFLADGSRQFPSDRHATAASETLPADVRAGKAVFFFAGNHPEGDNEMSFEGYMSCASCHIDGRHDGRVWDFTQRGEGLRNTTDLRGRAGTGQGNVHWTGNFDEIQDFVLDIVNEFDGNGFLPDGQSPHPSLGTPNGGRSAALDELAAYVTSLRYQSLPRSPYRQANGQLTAQAQAGRDVFDSLACSSCHDPVAGFTDSSLGAVTLHDVGTLRTSSGMRLGQPLTGIDTPTLLGVWNGAPYFHDGSAPTLEDVFMIAGGTTYQAEDASLAAGASIPDWIDINWDSSSHGALVAFGSDGASATFNSVDGGSGGIGAIELRHLPGSGGTWRLRVNGSTVAEQSFVQQATHFEWQPLRFEDVPLDPGASNTVVVERVSASSWQSLALDEIVVSTPDDLVLAQPHRAVQSLDAGDRADLLAWLRQLDGRNEQGEIVDPDLIFRDAFR